MRKRSKGRAFVSAVVVTVAAGCGGGGTGEGTTGEEMCCHNPPPIMSFQGLAEGDSLVRREGDICDHRIASTGGVQNVQCPPDVPTNTTISRRGDECTAMRDIRCPPPSEATCNPPPPMQVACPTP